MESKKIFGRRVFSDKVQRQRLPADIYESLKKTRQQGLELDPHVAKEVARAMMEWAIEQGATHYTLSLIHI